MFEITGFGRAKNWWGEAPDRLYDFDKAAGLLSLNTWLHQYARRAAVYRVNKAKRFVRPIREPISGIKPRGNRHGRPAAPTSPRWIVVLV